MNVKINSFGSEMLECIMSLWAEGFSEEKAASLGAKSPIFGGNLSFCSIGRERIRKSGRVCQIKGTPTMKNGL